jgi:hypothetical protein
VAIAVVVAAACSVLVEVGSFLLNRRIDRLNQQLTHEAPVAPHNQPQPAVMPRAIIVQNNITTNQKSAASPTQPTAAAKSSTWDDAIDTQITAVSQEIDSVQRTWQHRVDDVDLVQYRIDEVSEGLSKDAL